MCCCRWRFSVNGCCSRYCIPKRASLRVLAIIPNPCLVILSNKQWVVGLAPSGCFKSCQPNVYHSSVFSHVSYIQLSESGVFCALQTCEDHPIQSHCGSQITIQGIWVFHWVDSGWQFVEASSCWTIRWHQLCWYCCRGGAFSCRLLYLLSFWLQLGWSDKSHCQDYIITFVSCQHWVESVACF